MNTEASPEIEAKARLKWLRELRQEKIAASTARMKEQKQLIKAIKEQLQQPRTVPEVAEASGIPSRTVLWYVAALKKYGEIKEMEKQGSYFRYCLGEQL